MKGTDLFARAGDRYLVFITKDEHASNVEKLFMQHRTIPALFI